MADDVPVQLSARRGAIAIAIGVAAGLLLVGLSYAATWLNGISSGANEEDNTSVAAFGATLTMLFPLVQGIALGLALGRPRYGLGTVTILALGIMFVDILGAAIFLREGAICLVILSPLLFLMIWFGALISRAVFLRTNRTLQVSLVPLIVLAVFAVFAEARGPRPNYMAEITDSVLVNAPPEYVWRYVTSYPENRDPPEYWLWQAGLPYPTQSIADAPEVGAKRICAFNTGIAFEERIVELRPNEAMTFEVTAQPDHPEVTGHFQFDRGQIRLTRNADGTTTLTATSWYRLFVRPAAYFDWWTADITRQVHFRVLNHMKRLAEADFQQASPL